MDSAAVFRCKTCNAAVDTTIDRIDGSTTCPQCGVTWSIFSDDTDAAGAATPPAPGSDEDQFAQLLIPGYELRRQIGRGGMGFVFEARQASLDRSVAIKVLAPHLSNDPQFAARFEAEAAALARLAHPNIVSIYERGRCGDRLYFVMEFVAGDAQGSPVDLKSIIARGPLDDEEARRLIVQVMRALAVAHADGIVHRDVKPFA
jgi:serine/threonine protein kinase